jgi:hypothetical protein
MFLVYDCVFVYVVYIDVGFIRNIWVKRHLLKANCEEVDGRRRWIEVNSVDG